MSTRNNDIAVIGIGCRFPDADNGDAFFRNLMANRDSVREIPPERWSHADLYAQPGEEGRLSSKWGGFIAGVDEFDARFFKILPSEAELHPAATAPAVEPAAAPVAAPATEPVAEAAVTAEKPAAKRSRSKKAAAKPASE